MMLAKMSNLMCLILSIAATLFQSSNHQGWKHINHVGVYCLPQQPTGHQPFLDSPSCSTAPKLAKLFCNCASVVKVSRWVTKSVLGALSWQRKIESCCECRMVLKIQNVLFGREEWDWDDYNNDDHYDDLVCLHTVLSQLLLIHMNLHTVVTSLKRSSCPSLLDPLPRASSQVTSFVGKKKKDPNKAHLSTGMA